MALYVSVRTVHHTNFGDGPAMVACLARRLCTYVALLQFIACRGFLGPPIRKADVSKLESLKSRPYFSTDVFNQQLNDAASKEQPEGSDDTINHSERRLAQPYFSSAIFHQDHVHHIAKPRTNGHKTPETSTRPQSYFSSDAFKTPGMVTEATTLADFSSDAFKAPELPETLATADFAANIIAENMWSQCDSEGQQFVLLDEAVDHRKTTTVPQENRPGTGRTKPKSTQGWQLCVRWKDGSTTWEPLSRLKESNPVEIAEYATAKGLHDEPAFAWWVPYTISQETQSHCCCGKQALSQRDAQLWDPGAQNGG